MLELPMVQGLLRLRLLVVAVMALVMGAGATSGLGAPTDWDFFVWGSDALLGDVRPFERGSFREEGDEPGGLSLYASYPFLQIGPPALLVAALLQSTPDDGLHGGRLLCQALGFLTVVLLDRLGGSRDDDHRRMQVLIGGSLLMVVWASLTRFGHLDDAITVTALAAAALGLRRGDRMVLVGALLGLAAASKPWGVVGFALVLAAPTWRARATTAGAAAVVLLAFWGPFLVAAPLTADVAGVQVVAAPSSVPALLGVDSVADAGVLRLAQLVGGLLLGACVAFAGAWPAALMAAFALRLLLEPAAYSYYFVALATAALLLDLSVRRSAVPVTTSAVVFTWLLLGFVDDAATAGVVRLVLLCGLLLLCAALAVRAERGGSYAGTPSAAAPS